VKGPPEVGAISRSATVPPMACAWRAGVRLGAPAALGLGTFAADHEPGGWKAGYSSRASKSTSRERGCSVAVPEGWGALSAAPQRPHQAAPAELSSVTSTAPTIRSPARLQSPTTAGAPRQTPSFGEAFVASG